MKIESEIVPYFLRDTFNMLHGWDQLLYFRPQNQFEELSNWYRAGAGTHPGSGLPTNFDSAGMSSNLICAKYRIPYPKPMPFVEPAPS